MIDPFEEKVIPLRELGKKLPDRPRYTTVVGWVTLGRRNMYSGKRVRMECLKMPYGLASSIEAYKRFLAALNEEC
jgi:hypothetical protein